MFAEGRVENCVNMETEVLGTCVVSVRHLDKVGVLAGSAPGGDPALRTVEGFWPAGGKVDYWEGED